MRLERMADLDNGSAARQGVSGCALRDLVVAKRTKPYDGHTAGSRNRRSRRRMGRTRVEVGCRITIGCTTSRRVVVFEMEDRSRRPHDP